jgi:hypothetical protein
LRGVSSVRRERKIPPPLPGVVVLHEHKDKLVFFTSIFLVHHPISERVPFFEKCKSLLSPSDTVSASMGWRDFVEEEETKQDVFELPIRDEIDELWKPNDPLSPPTHTRFPLCMLSLSEVHPLTILVRTRRG